MSVVLAVTLLNVLGASPEDIRGKRVHHETGDLEKDPQVAALGAELEKLASKIPFINMGDFVHHRIPHEAKNLMDDEEREALMAFVNLADKANEPSLWKLTAHPNARVRTLAMISVYWQANPKRLPGLFALIDDRAITFPAVVDERVNVGILPPTVKERRQEVGERKQTVGGIARRIIAEYLPEIENEDGPARMADVFRGYWAARSNRTHCLSWFHLAMNRATQLSSPLRPESQPALHKLKAQVDALDPPYRSWILIALTASPETGSRDYEGRPIFAGTEDIVRAAREIGSVGLMDFFHVDFKSDDPDFRVGSSSRLYFNHVCRLILGHAARIFSPEDADALVALEKFHRGRTYSQGVFEGPAWAIAAADAAPKRAREILLAALDRFKDGPQYGRANWEQEERRDMRRELAQALWDHEGIAGVDVIRQWYRTDVSKRVAERFFKWLHADTSRRPLLDAVISGDR